MLSYIYDGSFPGLLTALHQAFTEKTRPDTICPKPRYTANLFSQVIPVKTCQAKADRVYEAIRLRISLTALQQVYYAFLSDQPGVEVQIYHYLFLGWKVGADLDSYLTDERVYPIHRISQKVGNERHRFLGLLRFRCLQGDVYYAPCEPDHNILPLLAPHFAKRMAAQRWIIHDLQRGLGAFYDKHQWLMGPLALDDIPLWDSEEAKYQRLWQEFFHSVSIKERANPILQRNHMPSRYWQYLVEKD